MYTELYDTFIWFVDIICLHNSNERNFYDNIFNLRWIHRNNICVAIKYLYIPWWSFSHIFFSAFNIFQCIISMHIIPLFYDFFKECSFCCSTFSEPYFIFAQITLLPLVAHSCNAELSCMELYRERNGGLL